MTDWIIVVALGLTVAFTAVPIVTAIVAVVGAQSARPAWFLTVGYAACLFVVTGLLATALQTVHFDSIDDPTVLGIVELVVGALLCIVGAVSLVRARSAPSRPSRMISAMRNVSPWVAVGVGATFPLHPEAFLLSATVATRVRHSGFDWVVSFALVAVYVALAVSTVAAIALVYARATEGMRARLERLQRWFETDSRTTMTCVIIVVGVVVIVFGMNTLGWISL